MKTLRISLLSAFVLLFTVSTALAYGDGDKKDGQVSVTVEKIVGKQKKADKLRAQLEEMDGVTEVTTCTKSGTVTVSYDAEKISCSSKIYSQLDSKGWKYAKATCKGKSGCQKSKCTKSGAAKES